MKKGMTIMGLIFLIALPVMLLIGWIMNIIKLCHLDFASPYKAEVIRLAGVVVPPLGAITGWVTFDEETHHD